MSNESTFNMDGMKIKSLKVGDEKEIEGHTIFSISPPSKGKPYWQINHADEYDEREQVLIAANVSVILTAETAPLGPEEKEVEIDE